MIHPPIIPRDAQHAERLYWSRNPPLRKPGELTISEVAKALGVTVCTVRRRLAAGKLSAERRNGQLFFKESQIADVLLLKELKK